jgi:hypothetical protein
MKKLLIMKSNFDLLIFVLLISLSCCLHFLLLLLQLSSYITLWFCCFILCLLNNWILLHPTTILMFCFFHVLFFLSVFNLIAFSSLILAILEFEQKVFHLLALYYLVRIPSPFLLSLFLEYGLTFLPGVNLKPLPSYFHLLPSWDHRMNRCGQLILLRKCLINIYPGFLPMVFSYLQFLSCWDYSHVPKHPILLLILNCLETLWTSVSAPKDFFFNGNRQGSQF